MRKNAAQNIIALIIALTAGIFAVNGQIKQTPPTLRDDKAVERLKQNGQYDSLMNAVKAARAKDGQTEIPTTENAVGQNTKLTASDGARNDNFGVSVAVWGDTAFVGSFNDDIGANPDQGSVYVFVRADTAWVLQQKLTAADGAGGDQFGVSIVVSGDTAIIGAVVDDVGGNSDQGSAYIFVRSGAIWTQQAQLTAADGAAGDQFGKSVALSGDTLIVGANVANGVRGAAYIFTRSGAVWSQQQKLTADDGAVGDELGTSVAISGDTVVVGAFADDIGGNFDQGSAYVFTRSGTIWTQQSKLTAFNGEGGDFFGINIGISNDTVIVATYDSDRGSAYVFVGSGAVWTLQQELTTSGSQFGAFGFSVAVEGNTAVVGAFVDDIGTNGSQGSVYIFTRSGTVWSQQQKLTAADGAASDLFGSSVAISGNNIFVGAYADRIGTVMGQGSAYAFRVMGGGWAQEAQKVASDGAADDQFGFSVAVNGDTAIVGAPLDDIGANSNQGSAYVFVRSGTAWTQQTQLTATGGAASDQFGRSVAIYGDTAIIGAVADDVGANTNQGSAYVFIRNAGVWTQQAQLTATDGAADDLFGINVSIDSNTAIVGAQGDDVGANSNQGSAYIFTRSGTTWSQQAQLTAAGGAAGDIFGTSVAISANTAIVGAYLNDAGANSDQGSVYVFVRSGTVWTQQAQLNSADGAASDFFGWSVAISGDTAIIGAFGDDVGANADQGSAYIFTRSGATWTEQQKITATGGAAVDQFGYSVGISGDTAVIGANQDTVGANAQQGSAYVFIRSGGIWTQQTQITATNGAAFDQFGWSAAISGDKIIVGAPFSNASVNLPFAPQANDQGAVFTFINNLVPTAANVSVSGRILTNEGAALRNAVVYLTKSNGETVTARTGSFGFYKFDELSAGETYTLSVISKRYTFTTQIVTANENLTEVDFIAAP